MRRIKLTREEKAIEATKYVPVSKEEMEDVARALAAARKNAVLNIRINQNDLSCLKLKAKKLGVKYQSFISEILHRVAHQ